MTNFKTIVALAAFLGSSACVVNTADNPFKGLAALLPQADPCKSSVAREAFKQGLNPAQANARIAARCK